ncbi:fungal-specific transcription factor domain-containing protein [Aspergillus pseudoustus]|uniref:Fungal-specific transcription factor domain-containing protein n=1 Tax=Aspergillus pseudoustus TaxID=1810923 RepID=A0ABR4KW39_9EURO
MSTASPESPIRTSHDPEPGGWGPQRVRVTRACDRCKKRKIRCTGGQPCDTCTRAAAQCAYAAPYLRGKRPPQLDTMQRQQAAVAVTLGPPLRHDSDGQPANVLTAGEASPEPVTDSQGHYIGPASGVSFLVRVQNRLHQHHRHSSTFTFGDVPLPDYDPVPSVMLCPEETARLVQRFFDFTMPIDRFFHQPTIAEWRVEFCETMGSMRDTPDAPAKRAALWMIFAMSQEHMGSESSSSTDDKSIRYFLAADYHLSKTRGTISLTTVQARLCQCFWLLSRSRVNHCWELFGSTARLALVLGLHRKHSAPPVIGQKAVDLDCCRRTFWSAYCLDNHLSITLGRPKIFHDRDIDQQLPSGANDQDLLVGASLAGPTAQRYSVMLAAVAYFKLHLILSEVLRDLYGIDRQSIGEQCTLAVKYAQMIRGWYSTVPRFLATDSQDSVPLIPIFQRQRDVLSVSYWHALIILYRPLLLQQFMARPSHSEAAAPLDQRITSMVSDCLDAALHIVNKVDDMVDSGVIFRSFWGTYYYGFSATVVLYVYTILVASTPVPEYQPYLDAAMRYHGHLAAEVNQGDSLLTRYCLVLEELRTEATNRINSNNNYRTPGSGSSSTTAAAAGEEPGQTINIPNILFAPAVPHDFYMGMLGFQAGGTASSADSQLWAPPTSYQDETDIVGLYPYEG